MMELQTRPTRLWTAPCGGAIAGLQVTDDAVLIVSMENGTTYKLVYEGELLTEMPNA